MTLADQDVPVLAWNEPDGLVARGTVVVIPGRGELPTVYERFGRRLAGDAYRVRVVADPVVDAELARTQISGLLDDPGWPAPRVLAGSDGRLVRDHAGQVRPGRCRGRTPPGGPARHAARWSGGLLGGGTGCQDLLPNSPRAAHCLGRTAGRAV